MPARRFPAPWTAELTPNCFIVRDADGQQLAYVYYESEPERRSAAKPLSKDEARHCVARQPARFLQFLNQAGFSVLRNRPYVQTGIRTLRRTIRSEHSAQTDAQTILVQR
jgi:hypothetical protein